MNTLFEKVMAFDERELERINREEAELVKRLGARKLHEFDNVAQDRDGRLYALETLSAGDDIVMRGKLYAKATADTPRGERVEL